MSYENSTYHDEITAVIKRVKEIERQRDNSLRHLEEQARPFLQRFLAYGAKLIEEDTASNVLKSITSMMIGATGVTKETGTGTEEWSLDRIDANKSLVWYHAFDIGRNRAVYLDEEYCADPDAWEEMFSANIIRLAIKRENFSK